MITDPLYAAFLLTNNRVKGHLEMLLGEELVRARIQELEDASARQRLAGLLRRRQRWAWLAAFARRQANKAEMKLG